MNRDNNNYPEGDRPFIEPTEAVANEHIPFYVGYSNPYEPTDPYSRSLPPIPPPPPKPKKKMGRSGIIFLCIVGLMLIGSVIYIGVNGVPWQQSQAAIPSPTSTIAPTATSLPTPTPTATAMPTSTPAVHTPIMTGAKAPYPASQIAGYFYEAGLAPQTTTIDTSWSCCQYYPEGGAVYWSDLQTGITMDLATFASIDEAQIDAQNLSNKGFGADVENYCLLSYGGNPSDLQSYFSIMQEECIYE